MGRTPGAPNKNILPEKKENIFRISEEKYASEELEDIFLTNCLEQYKFFKREAARIRRSDGNAELCEQYAEAYKLLINRFTYIEQPVQELEAEEL